jgi:Tol biopolymer transport system component
LCFAAFGVGTSVHAATTERVSVSNTGSQANDSSWAPRISADARFVVFTSYATNLVSGDTNGARDAFVHHRLTGITERVSVSSSGGQASGESYGSSVSADGRFVAFVSPASNLVPGDTNGEWDVFVRDRLTGTTERVSVSSGGEQGNFTSASPALSADGRFVAFDSAANNLVAGDTNGRADVFIRDRLAGTTERVSLNSAGQQGNDNSTTPSISADGRLVAFQSEATNLAATDTNGERNIFLRDRDSAITEQVDLSAGGQGGNCISSDARISADGRFVAFVSCGTNLVPGADTVRDRVYLRDRQEETTLLVSVSSAGQPANDIAWSPSISTDGRFVAFDSPATNLVPGDTNGWRDAFVRDVANETTSLVSLSYTGELGDRDSGGPAVSADGSVIAFGSEARNLVPGDTNGHGDIFVRDMGQIAPPGMGIAINQGAACTNSASVTLALALPDGSVEMRLRNEPGDWGAWEACATEKAWTLSAGDGVKTVCMQCRDAAMNETAEACDDILLDTTPPTDLSININNGAECAPAAVTLTVSAAGASHMRFSNDGQAWSPWQPYGTAKAWTLSPGRGAKTVWFQCRDSCGNESAPVSDDVWRILFDDVWCPHPQRPYIEGLAEQGIVSGCSTSPPLYCPTGSVSRAEIAEFICRAAGKTPLDSSTPTFADVPTDHPFYGWIERLADAASWGGMPPTNGCLIQGALKYFCPDVSVTRAQAAKLLCRATGRDPMPSCSGVFPDVWPSNPYCSYIERLAHAASWPGEVAVTAGCAPDKPWTPWNEARYCPASVVTRGQTAVLLVRAFAIPL